MNFLLMKKATARIITNVNARVTGYLFKMEASLASWMSAAKFVRLSPSKIVRVALADLFPVAFELLAAAAAAGVLGAEALAAAGFTADALAGAAEGGLPDVTTADTLAG